ncbi:MAG: Rrf2 family transcriptional regulator [Elusimicrobia bacterium]|nr:Rrf2 family transcriptional regulator [Elusimicrobiota bacterium]
MKITSSTEYATRLIVNLGRTFGAAAVSTEKLSESENVPADYVNQLLLRLKRAGLVQSHRGSGGGYSLSRSPEKITLGEVLRAVEGTIFEDVCGKYNDGRKDCHHQGHCGISPVWQKLAALIEQYFDSITLAHLMEEKAGSCGKVEAMLGRIPQ